MKKIKQILSMVLCLTMLLSLAACSSGDKEADSSDAVNGSDLVYVPEYKYIEDEISDMLVYGNTMYASVWLYDEETWESQYTFASWDLTTMEKKELPYTLPENSYVSQMTMTDDGMLRLLISAYGGETTTFSLVSLNGNGEVQSEQDITSLINSYSTDPEFGVWPQYMAADKEGNIYLYLSGNQDVLLVLDSEGNKNFDLTIDGWCQSMAAGGDGKVYMMTYDYSSGLGYCLKAVDGASKSWGETYAGIPQGSGSVTLCAEDETHFLVSAGDVLYRYDMTTQTAEEILNWIDSDINSSEMRGFSALEDGRILAVNYSWSDDGTNYELVLLTAKDASEVVQKTVLTYGTLYLDYDLREQIIDFNKNNDTYRIEVKDYSSSSYTSDGYDYEAGINAFNADLAAGNAPDLIDLSQLTSFTNYASKGVFADLNTFLDNDSDISREDLVENPLSIYEMDGKLYGIPMFYGVSTLMGRTSVLQGKTGWTVQDVQQILAEQPEGTEFLDGCSREYMMYLLIAYQLDNYIDWTTGTCSFDGEDFINTLQFVGSFPSYEDMNYEYEGAYSKIQANKVLVTESSISEIGWYLAMEAMYGGDDVTYIGFPTSDGSNGSMLIATQPLAISASCKNPEGAWEFVKYLLSEEHQAGGGFFSGFPILQSALEDYLAEAMSDENAGSGYGWNDFQYEQVPATQAQIDRLRELIDVAKPMTASTDSSITEIISEEAAAFFSGQKTAEAVAEIIQSRISIYVSENY